MTLRNVRLGLRIKYNHVTTTCVKEGQKDAHDRLQTFLKIAADSITKTALQAAEWFKCI